RGAGARRRPPLPSRADDVAGGDARHAATRAGAWIGLGAAAADGDLRHRRTALRADAVAGSDADDLRAAEAVILRRRFRRDAGLILGRMQHRSRVAHELDDLLEVERLLEVAV